MLYLLIEVSKELFWLVDLHYKLCATPAAPLCYPKSLPLCQALEPAVLAAHARKLALDLPSRFTWACVKLVGLLSTSFHASLEWEASCSRLMLAKWPSAQPKPAGQSLVLHPEWISITFMNKWIG